MPSLPLHAREELLPDGAAAQQGVEVQHRQQVEAALMYGRRRGNYCSVHSLIHMHEAAIITIAAITSLVILADGHLKVSGVNFKLSALPSQLVGAGAAIACRFQQTV